LIRISQLSIVNKLINVDYNDIVSPRSQYPRKTFKPIDPISFSRPQQFFAALTNAQLRVITYLLRLHRKYNIVSPAQETIALACGISRQYVNVVLRQLQDMGLICMTYRHRRTCRYLMAMIFRQPKIRHILAGFFTALSDGARAVEMVIRQRLTDKLTPLNLRRLVYIFNSKKDYRRENGYKEQSRVYPTDIEALTLQGSEMTVVTRQGRIINSFSDLTPHEQQEISIYPKRAIDYALCKYKGKSLFNPLYHLKSACSSYIKKPIEETPQTGKTEPVNNDRGYIPIEDVERRIPRETLHAYFVKIFTLEGQKIAGMFDSEKKAYCQQILPASGWKPEDIDKQWEKEKWVLIREARTAAADYETERFRKFKGWSKDQL
jgi:biotin operon repressor